MFLPTAVLVKTKPLTRGTALIGSPLIGQNIPFVGRNSPFIIPLVGQNLPFMTKRAGFTLVEMMIALVVLGVLATMAAPSMQTFIKEQRISGQANDLIGDLSIARSEAIRRAATVIVCKSTNPNNANPTCNTVGTNWATGRVIFVDSDNDGAIDSGEVLRRSESLDGTGNTLISTGAASDSVSFTGSGLTTLGAGTEWKLCDSRGATYGRAIAISGTGRARVTTKGLDMNDNALVCT